jgi:hypothetical protein
MLLNRVVCPFDQARQQQVTKDESDNDVKAKFDLHAQYLLGFVLVGANESRSR